MAKFNRVLKESCYIVVIIFHVPGMFFFARFKPKFSFANIALVAVTAIYFVNLEHKSAVVNALTHRANSLIRDENEKRMELKHIQIVLTLNGYPN